MLSIRGIFRNGMAQPTEPVEGYEGQPVIITFLEQEVGPSSEEDEAAWNSLIKLIDDCAVETGLNDLAQRHRRYRSDQ